MHGTERSHQNDRKQNHESVHSWDLVLFLVKKNCSDMRSIRTSSLQKPQLNFLFFGCFSSYQKCSRSEEHTSELQSRGHLVCRLLLEKKHKIVHILNLNTY